MLPSDLIQAAFFPFVVAPAGAAILAFKGPPVVRQVSRLVLISASLAYGAATTACIHHAFARPSSGIGNQVLLIVAIPFAIVALVLFGLWRAARRHEYVQSLPPAERRVEELADIERGLKEAGKSLAQMERRADRWGISDDERERLRSDIAEMKGVIETLEHERAKRA